MKPLITPAGSRKQSPCLGDHLASRSVDRSVGRTQNPDDKTANAVAEGSTPGDVATTKLGRNQTMVLH